MEKLDPKKDGRSPDVISENIEKLRELFPEAFTEGSDEDGPRWKVDFDALKEIIGEYGEKEAERYSFTWHGKSRARLIAQNPSTGTLRPCPEESVNWDTTKNLFIEGDNLEVLKLLQKSYHKKVKMIYIDPPYNTGNDFIYPDKFADNLDTYLRYTGQIDDEGFKVSTNAETGGRYHTNWLNMMYPRLKLARNLLMDDGFFFVSVDDVEAPKLRLVLDEIFGEENFVESLIWKKKYGGGAKTKYYVGLHEYILCYVKNKDAISKIETPYKEEHRKYYKFEDERVSERGPYRLQPLGTTSNDFRPNLRYPIIHNGKEVWPEVQWQWEKERTEKANSNGELVFTEAGDSYSVNFKQYLYDEDGNERRSKPFSIIDGIYTQHGTNEIKRLFGNGKAFTFPKPSSLLVELQRIFFDHDYIVVDFFAGSCPVADSVFQLNSEDGGNRRFIAVQLPEPTDADSFAATEGFSTISDLARERIRRSIKEFEAAKESVVSYGFKAFRLDSSNIKPWDADFDNVEQALLDSVDNIKSERSEEDVLYELLLKYGLDLAVPIETRNVLDKKVYVIGGGALIATLSDGIDTKLAEGIVSIRDEIQPEVIRVVFKDSGFKDDVAKSNVMQVLKQAGIEDVKSL